jgi:hypothetical protein
MRVSWLQSTLNDLTRLWTTADSASRQAITKATHLIDEALQVDPWSKGESRDAGKRILFVPPLAILFKTNIRLQETLVVALWLIRKRGK